MIAAIINFVHSLFTRLVKTSPDASSASQENTSNFMWSDAWVMQTVRLCSRGADIEELISTGDFVNHAIFMLDELKMGLERLIAAGYVEIKDGKFYATKKFHHGYKPPSLFIGHIEEVKYIWQFLQQQHYDENAIVSIDETILNEQIFNEAIRAYDKRMRKYMYEHFDKKRGK